MRRERLFFIAGAALGALLLFLTWRRWLRRLFLPLGFPELPPLGPAPPPEPDSRSQGSPPEPPAGNRAEGDGPRGRGRTRMRRRALLLVLTGAASLVLAETALVVAVVSSPQIATKTQKTVVAASEKLSRAWRGSPASPGLEARLKGAASQAYQGWVKPLWALPVEAREKPTFATCVSCHRDYAEKKRFPSGYMDHPLHAQVGVACSTCHTQVEHPNPPAPEEATCVPCHKEVKEGRCETCHPPGSLPHFYLLGAPREGVANCNACHRPGSFQPEGERKPLVRAESFDGSDRSRCLSCHPQYTCDRCHPSRHPANWLSVHGESVGYEGAGACYSCHTNTWCASRCHTVTPTQPFKRRPLPEEGRPG